MVRFRLKVGIVAVEPIDTPVGFEVRFIQNPPDTRSTHRPGVALRQGGDQGVETPARGGPNDDSPNSTRVTYWEGSVAVRDSMQGQAKEGVGYVDLSGYVQQVNL